MDGLTYNEIERAVHERTGIPSRVVKDVLQAFNTVMMTALVENKSVRLGRIGKLYAVVDKPRIRYNVALKEVREGSARRRLKLLPSWTMNKLLRNEETV